MLDLDPDEEALQPDIGAAEEITEILPAEQIAEDLPHSVSFSFTNTYEPEETSLTILGHKTLTGRTLQEEEFSFLLYRTAEGFALPENASPIGRARNNEDGGFTFAELSFRSAGWHYFLVTEDASDAAPGIRYDDTRYRVRVYVEDIGGRLPVQNAIVENPSGEDSDILFRNAYAPADAIFHLTGRKLLDGRPLEAGEFTFHLYEASYLTAYGFIRGDLIARASNDLLEDGTGSFDFRIQYSEPGVFHYILMEVPGEEEGMTYDETQYGIEVVVTDNQVGSLQAEITRLVQIGTENTDADEILFRNTYTEPEDTTPA